MTTLQNQLSDEVLDHIMQMFWERGYFNTSIDDLVVTTGVNRAALYKNFGGKHGLFIAMLQRFRTRVVGQATRPLIDPAGGMSNIKQFFQQFLNRSAMLATYGCLLVATASDLPMHKQDVAEVIDEFIQYVRSLFYKNLRLQQAEKFLSAELNPEVMADFLVGNLVGLLTLLRSGAEARMIENHVQGIMNYLSSLPACKHAQQNNLHYIT